MLGRDGRSGAGAADDVDGAAVVVAAADDVGTDDIVEPVAADADNAGAVRKVSK